MVDSLKKENFSLKLRVHFLEETLEKINNSSSGSVDHADLLSEHVELQIKYETLQKDFQVVKQESAQLLQKLRQSTQSTPGIIEDTIAEYRRDIERLEDVPQF